MADVLRMEFMSSEESEVEEETLKVKRYKVRSFAWESREFKAVKTKTRPKPSRVASWPI